MDNSKEIINLLKQILEKLDSIELFLPNVRDIEDYLGAILAELKK